MPYAILRTAKLKSMGNISASLSHTYRMRETSNADPVRQNENQHSAPSAEVVLEAIREKLPEKVRANGVLCIEYLITASPEYFENKDADGSEYFKTALKWLEDKHGHGNVVAHSVHHDETTPHLIAYVVPLDDKGKLNARAFLGGKAKLTAMQTDFATAVKEHGLERGIERSGATHTTIKEYYARVNNSIPKLPKLPRPKAGVFETTGQYGDRVMQTVIEHITPKWKEMATLASETSTYRKEAQEARKALKDFQDVVRPYLDAIEPLRGAERAVFVHEMRQTSNELQNDRKAAKEAEIREKQLNQEREHQEKANEAAQKLLNVISKNLTAAEKRLEATPIDEKVRERIKANIENLKAQQARPQAKEQAKPKSRGR